MDNNQGKPTILDFYKLFYKLEENLKHIKDDLCSLKKSNHYLMILMSILLMGVLGVDINRLLVLIDTKNLIRSDTNGQQTNRLE
ncbi:hypothetical protein Syn6312_1359 [Synechococcus sp. PCC 6312]|nr:hypothetical protein Syn6312_1359 [Synechococcus sp. PCC 6312]